MARNTDNILIILDYLIRFTDEKHMSSAKDIDEYALKEYGVNIDRRSIKEFLEQLKELNDKYQSKFPFVIKSDGGERPKYYIEDRVLTKAETIAVANAIKNDPYTPDILTTHLLQQLLKKTVSENEYSDLYNSISSDAVRVEKQSKDTFKKIKTINKAIQDKCMITYTSIFDTENKNISTNYFYKLAFIGDKTYALIIKDGGIVSYSLEFIKIIKVEKTWFDDPRTKFKLEDVYDGKTGNPEDEVKYSKVPHPAIETTKCEFTFPNEPYCVEKVGTLYKQFFHEDLLYKVKNNVCYSSITCQADVFIEWCSSYEVSKFITVTGSENLKVQLSMHYQVLLHKNDLNHWKFIPADSKKK